MAIAPTTRTPALALIEARAELNLLLMYADTGVTISRMSIERVLSKLQTLTPV